MCSQELYGSHVPPLPYSLFLPLTLILMFWPARWLAKQHLDKKALQTLTKIRRTSPNEVQAELAEIELSVRQTQGMKCSETIRLLFSWRISQRSVLSAENALSVDTFMRSVCVCVCMHMDAYIVLPTILVTKS